MIEAFEPLSFSNFIAYKHSSTDIMTLNFMKKWRESQHRLKPIINLQDNEVLFPIILHHSWGMVLVFSSYSLMLSGVRYILE